MRIKKIELNNFKRFTHLIVDIIYLRQLSWWFWLGQMALEKHLFWRR